MIYTACAVIWLRYRKNGTSRYRFFYFRLPSQSLEDQLKLRGIISQSQGRQDVQIHIHDRNGEGYREDGDTRKRQHCKKACGIGQPVRQHAFVAFDDESFDIMAARIIDRIRFFIMILLVFIMVWLFYFNDGLDLHRYIHRKLVCANSSTCMMTLIAQRIVQQLRSSIHYDTSSSLSS